MRIIEQVLDEARWAPSGDNTQPWRFEILDDMRAVIHGFDTRHDCVYDLDGYASHLAHGILLETLAIAATAVGCRTEVRHLDALDNGEHRRYEVTLVRCDAVLPSPLVQYIRTRSVQRRPMKARSIAPDAMRALEQAAHPCTVTWFASTAERWKIARLNFSNAEVRLTIPEAYEVHKRVIEWGASFSADRIPEGAVGIDPLTARMMKWVMGSWKRVEFFNRWLAGTLMPRVQLDLMPGIFCGAHALLSMDTPLDTVERRIEAGRAIARFWLTCAQHDLLLQPEMTPLIFARYVAENRIFSNTPGAVELSRRNATTLRQQHDIDVLQACWLCRIGYAVAPKSRSLRLTLEALVARPAERAGQAQDRRQQ